MTLTIDINGICNERCRFCYQNLDGAVLGEDEIFRTIARSDAETIEIGGGEPLIDPRIIQIVKRIRKEGKKVHISTNASEIPDGFLDIDYEIKNGIQMQVSIHGSNRELYADIHGRDLFHQVINNTRKLRDNYSTLMTSAIFADNFDDVPNIVELAKSLQIPLRVNLVFPVGSGKSVELLNQGQIDTLRGYLLGQNIATKGNVDSPLIHQNNCYAITESYGIERQGICPVDCGKVYVSPRGERSACEFYPVPVKLTRNGALIGGLK